MGGVERPSGAAVDDLPVDKAHLAFVRQAMADVVTSGTAAASANLGLGPITMAGKTGTAQSHTYREGERTSRNLAWALKDHAWFVAFAPADDPRYAISVLVEHGGFGAAAAAPRAREIMRVALLKDPEVRKRIEVPLDQLAPAPPIAGRSPTYLARALYDFKGGARNGPGAQLMKPVADGMSLDDMVAAAAYAASLTP